MKVLIFDTETTGLPPRIQEGKNLRDYLEVWPYLMQLTFIIYDIENMKVDKIYNKYINIPQTEIEKIQSEIIKSQQAIILNKELLKSGYNKDAFKNIKKAEKTISILSENIKRWDNPQNEKVSIRQANHEFFSELEKVDLLVAHNIMFDYKMMIATALRDSINQEKNIMLLDTMKKQDKCFCTMVAGKKICKCFKYPPSLTKTYGELFGHEPDESKLHDSLFDVVITLKVFVKLITGKDISDIKDIKDDNTMEVIEMLKEVEPEGEKKEEVEDLRCPKCNNILKKYISHTKKNPNRPFVKCDNCGYFSWEEKVDTKIKNSGVKKNKKTIRINNRKLKKSKKKGSKRMEGGEGKNNYKYIYEVNHCIDKESSKQFLKDLKKITSEINKKKGFISHEILKLENDENNKEKINFTVLFRVKNRKDSYLNNCEPVPCQAIHMKFKKLNSTLDSYSIIVPETHKNKDNSIQKYRIIYQVDHIIDKDISKQFLSYIKSLALEISKIKGFVSYEILRFENKDNKDEMHYTVVYRIDNNKNYQHYKNVESHKFRGQTGKKFAGKWRSSRKDYNVVVPVQGIKNN